MSAHYLDAVRKFEGFTPRAEWDYAQHSNGYGTRALYPGEQIDRTEAERRFISEIADARAIVERQAPSLDEGTKAALTSLTFNAGDAWTRSGLGDAVRSGDLDAARALFLQYDKAGGKVLPGLMDRRAAEAKWIGNPEAAAGLSAQSPSAISESASPRPPTISNLTSYLADRATMAVSERPTTEDAQATGATVSIASANGANRAHAGPLATGAAASRLSETLLRHLLDSVLLDQARVPGAQTAADTRRDERRSSIERA